MSDDNTPVKTNGNLPDHVGRMQDLLDGISNIANSIADAGGVASGLPFIGLNGDGQWSFGQERLKAQPGSKWAVDIRTLSHGYIAWPDPGTKDRKPLGERMVPANSPLPPLSSLPNVGVPYQQQFSFEMLCLSGDDKGTLAIYKNGSHGAKKLIQALVNDIRKQARLDPESLCPVATLEVESYFNAKWGKTNHNPVLNILYWIGYGDYDNNDDPEDAPPPPAPEPVVTPPRPQEATPTPQPKAAARGQGRPAPAPEPVATARGGAEAPTPIPTPGPARRRQRPQVVT